MATLLFATTWIFFPPASRAATPEQTNDGSPMTLVFSDDFSTDPNSNGLWTIHRYDDDPENEAYWNAAGEIWHLTRVNDTYKAVAVFANYDLTATEWKAEFDYRVGRLGGIADGGDGFVFMFYKDKAAYAHGKPGFGEFMGFELSTPGIVPVKGYGLRFDNYYNPGECDPTRNTFIALVQDTVCSPKIWGEDDRTNDGLWHTVEFTYSNGQFKIKIDNTPAWNAKLQDPDYRFSGVGFGAGTGAAVADHEIDNFRLWVR
jgi:Bacterial lectin